MSVRIYLKLVLIITLLLNITGCSESNFELSSDSRLPGWFDLPAEMSRSEVTVTMDYYISPRGGTAVFKLFDRGIRLNKVKGHLRGLYPIELKNPPEGFPRSYPKYEVITVNSITEIIEHRKMEPVFYITDDPEILKELIMN